MTMYAGMKLVALKELQGVALISHSRLVTLGFRVQVLGFRIYQLDD